MEPVAQHLFPSSLFRQSHARLALFAALLLCLFVPAAYAQRPGNSDLVIYAIDVEGGQSTLLVSPSGGSLLVDTGWPGNNGRDAERIQAAMKDAGILRSTRCSSPTSTPTTLVEYLNW